jgi:hypothetical protein
LAVSQELDGPLGGSRHLRETACGVSSIDVMLHSRRTRSTPVSIGRVKSFILVHAVTLSVLRAARIPHLTTSATATR